MNSYSFGIITVCKNGLENLKHTHQGVQEQTIQDFEWEVMDSNSAGGTVKFLNGPKVAHTLWLTQTGKELYDGINIGFA